MNGENPVGPGRLLANRVRIVPPHWLTVPRPAFPGEPVRVRPADQVAARRLPLGPLTTADHLRSRLPKGTWSSPLDLLPELSRLTDLT